MNINVNLKPCDCSHRRGLSTTCLSDCASTPVLIPCPVPRTVTFEVQLGECAGCGSPGESLAGHDAMCPSRSVRVSCSIGGDGTWVGSEVTDVDNPHDPKGRWGSGTGDVFQRALDACRARWALVNALVLGGGTSGHVWQHHADLVKQRDAVYSALADMARAEIATLEAEQRFHALLPRWPPDVVLVNVIGRGSTRRIACYVEYLIEQVGSL